MYTAPRIPELGQRDRFVRRAVKEGRVLTLADEERASVPSQKIPGRTVQLPHLRPRGKSILSKARAAHCWCR